MDEPIEKQNEEHGDGYLWPVDMDEEMDGKKLTERSNWMDAWLDRQKDGEFNSYVNKQIER